MSDFKIRPPATPMQPAAGGVEGATPAKGSATFELGAEGAAAGEVSAAPPTGPAELVEQIRSGQLEVEQAVEILIDQALQAQPAASAPEELRNNIREALIELVRDDPTLVALASAMKR